MGVEDAAVHKWITPRPEVEPEVRHTLDEIFVDLPLVSGDEGLTPPYLNAIEDPLQRLQTMVQIVGVVCEGTVDGPERRLAWRRTHYIIAPATAFYRLTDETPTQVHKLGVDCEGIGTYTREQGEPVAVYGSIEALKRDLEGSVPWCNTCLLEAIEHDHEA